MRSRVGPPFRAGRGIIQKGSLGYRRRAGKPATETSLLDFQGRSDAGSALESQCQISFQNRIEFHDPSGKVYIAKTFGKETIFGKWVQKGIAARVLEYANEMLEQAYVVDPALDKNGNVLDSDGDGKPDWYIPRMVNGLPQVKYDPSVAYSSCIATDQTNCTCTSNKACVTLQSYVEVPFYIRQTMAAYRLYHPSMRGLY